MSKPKYKQGACIESIADFDSCENTYYKWHRKTLHKKFLMSWQYAMLREQIRQGLLYRAEKIEEESPDVECKIDFESLTAKL